MEITSRDYPQNRNDSFSLDRNVVNIAEIKHKVIKGISYNY